MPTYIDTNMRAGGLQAKSKGATRRGLQVFHMTELMNVQGVGKEGKHLSVEYEQPMFRLSLDERVDMFQACSPVFGVVSSRMNRIAGLEWDVIPESKQEDKIAQDMKMKNAIYKEYSQSDSLKDQVVASVMKKQIQQQLSDVKDDMSNFDSALMRWSRRIKMTKQNIADEIQEWLYQPSIGENWDEFIKAWVFDLMIHGNSALYKEEMDKKIENIYLLPGGTIIPVKSQYVGGVGGYIQFATGYDPQIYFTDEIAFSRYIPTTARSYGMIPLEALVNKVAETLLFDELMAEQADGTKPPDKALVFGDMSSYGDLSAEFRTPLDPSQEQRIEHVVNEARQQAIKVLSGVGMPMVLDLSRENTMGTQMERQRMIREEVGLVFNMSNIEMNMSSSDGVSGRSTSESLETIDQNKGVIPLVNIIMNTINRNVLPFRYGTGYKLEFQISKDPMAELTYYEKMINSKLYSINEVRTGELGLDPFAGEEYDKPMGAGGGEGDTGGGGDPMSSLEEMMGGGGGEI